MTAEETKGNKLIAVFMGMVPADNGNYFWETSEKIIGRKVDDLQYHYSWEWLMPVIHECWEVTTEEEREFKGLTLFELGLFTPIEELFAAVVEFIEWYNKTKK